MASPLRFTRKASVALSIAAGLQLAPLGLGLQRFASAQRVLGIDVSDWQGTLTLANWQTIHSPAAQGGGGRDFAFIRSSRGGTTGSYDENAELRLLESPKGYRGHDSRKNGSSRARAKTMPASGVSVAK